MIIHLDHELYIYIHDSVLGSHQNFGLLHEHVDLSDLVIYVSRFG